MLLLLCNNLLVSVIGVIRPADLRTCGLSTFTFPINSATIRTLTDENGTPWFVASDVAAALGYDNPSTALTVADTAIRQDAAGRYCLNDLHRAAGGLARHRPNYWLDVQQTKDLIDEVSIAGIPAILTKQGLGTYVVKELVYAYAMWCAI